MPATQIRITKTPELSEILSSLKSFYKGMTENEIIKKTLVEDYRTHFPYKENEPISKALNKEISETLAEVKNGEFSGPFTKAESLAHLTSLSKK